MTGSLAASFRLQSTIVHAIIMQDMNARYARSRLGAFTAVLEPVVVVVGLYLLRFYVQGTTKVGGVSLALFIVTGFMTFYCFRLALAVVIGATERKASSRMFPQVTSMDAIVARVISAAIINGGVMAMSFALCTLATGEKPNDLLLVIVAGVLTLALTAPVGVILGVMLRNFPSMKIFVTLMMRAAVIFSGVVAMATEMPPSLLPYVAWNPVFHTIELMREAWFPGYVSPVADARYVVDVLIVLTAVAMSLERMTNRFKFS